MVVESKNSHCACERAARIVALPLAIGSAGNVIRFSRGVQPRSERTSLEMPSVQPVMPGATGVMSPESSPPGIILVVDDNRDAADTTASLLETIGYTVLTAYSAREGLDHLDERPDIRLVISDIRMPDVDGFDFMRVVNHRFPDLPTLLTTGLPVTDDDVVPRGALILQKPFAAHALERAVGELLQDRTASPPDPA